MKHLNLFVILMIFSVASFAQTPITGTTSTCIGVATPYSDATIGGTWSSSNSSVATINATTGLLTGIMAGTTTVIYTLPSSAYVTLTVTMNTAPCAIMGTATICAGGTTILTDCLGGGVWSSAVPVIASIGGGSGMVTGVSSGSAVITYSASTGCYATITVAVTPLPTAFIVTGGGAYCAGGAGADIGLSGSQVGVNYQLYCSGVAVGSPIAGTGTTLSFGLQTVVGTYTVVATYATSGCTNTMTGSVTVSIVAAPTIYTVTGGGSYCAGGGSGSDVTLISSDFGVTYTLDSDGVADMTLAGTGSVLDFGYHLAGTYTINATAGGTSCTISMAGSAVVAVGPLPAAYTVTGGGSYCAGGAGVNVGLSSSNTGINYQLYCGGIPVGGLVAGTGITISFGMQTAVGTYTVVATNVITGCTNTMTGSVTVSTVPTPSAYTVSGGGGYCGGGGSGGDITLSSSDTGVTYTLDSDGVADMSLAGTGSSLDFGYHLAGTYTITATRGGTSCTMAMSGSAVVALGTLPATYTVTGGGAYCSGGTGVDVGLGGSDAGINYQLYYGSTVVGTPIAGTGSTLSFGLQTAAGTYTVVATNAVTACTNTMTGSVTVTINPLPTAYTVTGGGSYCTGGAGVDVGLSGSQVGVNYQIALSGAPFGSAVAGTSAALDFGLETTVGVYLIVATNTATTCTSTMTGSATITITTPPVFTASASSVACDGSYTLTASTSLTGYSWAPATGLSCTSCSAPTCNPTATTTYTLTGGSGCTSTATVSVDGNRIMGSISPVVSGTIEVWLIQFDPTDSSISALDSMVACTSGGSQYYNFGDPASGNYMVKAYLTGGTPGASGYIPTYGLSSAHWYSATGITHTGATDTLSVNMIYGTVPSGPGFISGLVASGAGRGTSVPAPVVNMLIYLTDASGNVLTYTMTDGSGNYSFSDLANGTYIIYPEDYQYNTTASSVITLSSSSESVTNVDFKQFTNSMIIIPFDYSNTGVKTTTAQDGISVFPNPAADNLNISWGNQTTGTANLVITDVLGRELYKSAMNINAASGTTQIGLQGFKDGIYLLTIKGESINYSSKVLIEE